MKTQYYTATSLDGYIADSDNALDWLLQFPLTGDYPAFIREVGALAMGSTTYEWILADLAKSQGDQPRSWPYEQPTWVFTSRTLPALPGAAGGVDRQRRAAHAGQWGAAASASDCLTAVAAGVGADMGPDVCADPLCGAPQGQIRQ